MFKGKIFGIGFHKTGTTSLQRALEGVSYRVCDVIGHNDPNIRHNVMDLVSAQLPLADAFMDNPWPIVFRELDGSCPGSKFILTIRPEESWIGSVVKYFGNKSTPMREWIYGVGSPIGNEEIYLTRYRKHNEEVLDYFRERPNDLLVLRICEGEGWEKLGPFLDCDPFHSSFPHENPARLSSSVKLKRKVASMLGRR